MIYNIVIAIIYFSSMLVSYTFFSQIGEQKLKTVNSIIIGILLFESGAAIDILFSNTVWLNVLFFMLINTLFGFLCFRIKFTRIIFYSIIMDIFNGTLEIITLSLISRVTHTAPNIYQENISIFIIDALISKILYFLVCVFLAKFLKREKAYIKFPPSLYVYPIVVLSTLLALWEICIETNISNGLKILLSVISFALFLSIVVLFLAYQNGIEKESQLIILEKENEKFQTEKNYYDILEKQNEDLMIYAHDAKKHLSAIRELNNNPQIDEYLSRMTQQLKKYSSVCHSGNHELDVIIDKYSTECKIKNIDFSFDLKLANFNYIENYDLVTIFGNLLDNAIESAEMSERREINLSTNHRNTYDILILTNSCDNPPDKDLKTNKTNKKIHGYGMKSIAKILKRYKGDYEWKYSVNDKKFTITLMFLCK